MATNGAQQTHYEPVDIDYHFFSDDDESIASNETDDGQLHPPEKVLAEQYGRLWVSTQKYYLVKWKDCSIVRSSWEDYTFLESRPQLLADWEAEKERQQRGDSKPLDLKSFNRLVAEVEEAERRRRTLRRLKRHVECVLSIVDV